MTFYRWAAFLAVCFAVFLGLELWSYFSGTPTLSQSIWAWNDAMPVLGTIVSFSVGFIFGHFFWGRRVIAIETVPVALFDEPYDSKSLKQNEDAMLLQMRRAL